MSEFERERRKQDRVRGCFTGTLALSMLSCRLEEARRTMEAGKRLEGMDLWDLARLGNDVRDAFGGKSTAAVEAAKRLNGLKDDERRNVLAQQAMRDGIAKVEALIPGIMESASEQCGRALRPPPPRKAPEPMPIPEVSGRRRVRR